MAVRAHYQQVMSACRNRVADLFLGDAFTPLNADLVTNGRKSTCGGVQPSDVAHCQNGARQPAKYPARAEVVHRLDNAPSAVKGDQRMGNGMEIAIYDQHRLMARPNHSFEIGAEMSARTMRILTTFADHDDVRCGLKLAHRLHQIAMTQASVYLQSIIVAMDATSGIVNQQSRTSLRETRVFRVQVCQFG